MAVYLHVKHGFDLYVVKLREKPITIGRSESCNLPLKDPLISGKHCAVYLKHGHACVKDLDSTNGTKVNSDKITERPLYLTDKVFAGKKIKMFLSDEKMTPEERAEHTEESEEKTMISHQRVEETSTGVTSPHSRSQVFEQDLGNGEELSLSGKGPDKKKRKSRISSTPNFNRVDDADELNLFEADLDKSIHLSMENLESHARRKKKNKNIGADPDEYRGAAKEDTDFKKKTLNERKGLLGKILKK